MSSCDPAKQTSSKHSSDADCKYLISYKFSFFSKVVYLYVVVIVVSDSSCFTCLHPTPVPSLQAATSLTLSFLIAKVIMCNKVVACQVDQHSFCDIVEGIVMHKSGWGNPISGLV